MALYLTYDNQKLQDGIGAQALRILGIFSISQAFHIKYLHSPILKVVEDFTHVKNGKAMTVDLVSKMNS